MDKLQKQLVTDKISKDDFTQQLGLSEENITKDSLNVKIKEITDRSTTNTNTIASLVKQINASDSQLKTKMSNIEKEMADYIKRISLEDGVK